MMSKISDHVAFLTLTLVSLMHMAYHPRVTAWTAILHTPLPPVSLSPATVLALWRLGLGLARAAYA